MKNFSALFTVFCLFLATFTATSSAHAEPNFPIIQGSVTDAANLIKPGDRSILEEELKKVHRETTFDFRIVTIETFGGLTPKAYAKALFAKRIKSKKEAYRNILLLLSRDEQSSYIQNGFDEQVKPLPELKFNGVINEEMDKGNFSTATLKGSHEITLAIWQASRDERTELMFFGLIFLGFFGLPILWLLKKAISGIVAVAKTLIWPLSFVTGMFRTTMS